MLIKSPMVTVGIKPYLFGKTKMAEQSESPSTSRLYAASPVSSQESPAIWKSYGLKFGMQSLLFPKSVQQDLREHLLEQGYSSQCFLDIQKLLTHINRELEIPIQGAISSGKPQIKSLEKFDAQGRKMLKMQSVKIDLGHGYYLTKALSREYQDQAVKRERTFISLHTAVNDNVNNIYIHAVLQKQPSVTQPQYTIVLQPRSAATHKTKIEASANAEDKIETDTNTKMGFHVTLKPKPTDRINYSVHYKFLDFAGPADFLLEYLPDQSKNIKNLMMSHDMEDRAPGEHQILTQSISHINAEGKEFIIAKEYAVLPDKGLTLCGVHKYMDGKELRLTQKDIRAVMDAELTLFYNHQIASKAKKKTLQHPESNTKA